MLDDHKNIDRIFGDVLEDFEEDISSHVWENLSQELDNKRKKKVVLYLQRLAACAAIFLAFFGGYWFSLSMNENKFQQNNLISNNNINKKINITPDSKIEISTLDNKGKIVDNKKDNNIKIFIKDNENTQSIPKSENKKQLQEENDFKLNYQIFEEKKDVRYAVIDNKKEEKNKNTVIQIIKIKKSKKQIFKNILNSPSAFERILANTSNNKPKSFENKVDEPKFILPKFSNDDNDNTKICVNTQKDSRWKIGGDFSPTYNFRDLNNSQTEINSMTKGELSRREIVIPHNYNRTEEALTAYAGGLSLEYRLLKYLSVSSGLYYSQGGQTIESTWVEFYGVNKDKMEVYTANTSVGSVDFSARLNNKSGLNNNTMNLKMTQKYEYIEIPLTLKFGLFDRKFGVNLLGGISANFLVGNKVFVEENDKKRMIGHTDGLKSFVWNSIIGIGLEYSLSKYMKIHIQPTFKQSITPISQHENVQAYAYSFGIYSGLNFAF